ncbi:MAG TPA: four helix bundle protein [Chitinophagaceae bacterium]
MRKKNILKEKTFAFAVRIIKLYKYLKSNHNEYILSKQIIRSGTSIGALIRESENAESKKNFIHKLNISLKETDETQYWLELLYETEFITKKMFDSINSDVEELIKMLVASVKTTKMNLKITTCNLHSTL